MIRKRTDPALAQLFEREPTKGERTKLRMVEAAVKMLGTAGGEALSFESVGRLVGMNRAQVKYHFPRREQLVEQTIQYIVRTAQTFVVERVKRAKTWREEILAVVESFLDWLEEYPNQGAVLLYFYYSATHDRALRDLHTRMSEMGFQRMRSILTTVAKEHRWTRGEVDSLSRSIWAVTDGFAIYTLCSTPKARKKPLREDARYAIEKLLRKGS